MVKIKSHGIKVYGSRNEWEQKGVEILSNMIKNMYDNFQLNDIDMFDKKMIITFEENDDIIDCFLEVTVNEQ